MSPPPRVSAQEYKTVTLACAQTQPATITDLES